MCNIYSAGTWLAYRFHWMLRRFIAEYPDASDVLIYAEKTKSLVALMNIEGTSYCLGGQVGFHKGPSGKLKSPTYRGRIYVFRTRLLTWRYLVSGVLREVEQGACQKRLQDLFFDINGASIYAPVRQMKSPLTSLCYSVTVTLTFDSS